MTPVEPRAAEGTVRVVFATDQPEYVPLPATVDANSTVVTEWEPTAEELACLLNGGHVRLTLLFTGVRVGRPLTPMMVEAVDAR